MKLPFAGQPVQGHSGIKHMPDGTYWVITDNGFGSKANSPDAALFLSHYRIDWNSGTVNRLNTVFLHDPDRKVPFRIVHEGTDKRYLTGSDFDIEGFQIINGKLWIGDEFGPYLLRADMSGKVEAVFETLVDGKPVMSPDHFRVTTQNPGQAMPESVNLGRSRGYEGLAASKDGRFIYGLLEGPLWDAQKKDWEKVDGQQVLRVLEFSVAEARWTGRHWKYVLSPGATASERRSITIWPERSTMTRSKRIIAPPAGSGEAPGRSSISRFSSSRRNMRSMSIRACLISR
jgi:hypothetical protein